MNAARRLFLKQGVAATTIEEITVGAGVAKGTFYLYFSSKENVLAALGERFAEGLLAGIKAAVAERTQEDWAGKLAAWAKAGATGYLDSIQLHDIAFHGSRPPTRKGREGMVDNIVIDHLCVLLRDGMDAGAWRIDDPRFMAVSLFSALHGVVDDAYVREKRVNRARLVKRLEELCLRAVGIGVA